MGPEPLATVPEDREIAVPNSRGADGGQNILQGDKNRLSSQSDSFADLIRQVAVDPLGRINEEQASRFLISPVFADFKFLSISFM